MAKKIQISAVEMKAQSQVIVLDASFVAKAVRAADAAQKLKRHLDEHCPVITEDAGEIDKGVIVTKEVGKNWAEWMARDCNVRQLGCDAIADVFEKLVPFVTELSDALLGEE